MIAVLPLVRKIAIPVLIGGALLVFGLLFLWLFLVRFDTMMERAAERATQARDAFWTGEIERSNAAANRAIADQAKAALEIETAANLRIRMAENQFFNLETANAALPGGDDCGLGRDRVRVLPH